ncbi:MAG: hypothetical protein IPF92_13555 [Myxococcales bacterium]|jgi:hypothetical protein|nr:hypothetical protein [Myxococcales bacterium]MBL0194899.1 hypothetical protein [Myxococcales bacterium]HQY64665.1 hypothetical protein [Polyangiaceae bacterium]
MSKEAFVAEVKRIVGLTRGGDLDAANHAFAALFASPIIDAQRPEDRRQAFKLLVLAKRSGAPSASLLSAISAARSPIDRLVAETHAAEDYEMLGVCHVLLGDPDTATTLIREGLRLEREKNPQSDLCGRLMTRLSAL